MEESTRYEQQEKEPNELERGCQPAGGNSQVSVSPDRLVRITVTVALDRESRDRATPTDESKGTAERKQCSRSRDVGDAGRDMTTRILFGHHALRRKE
jgi:hypothetical protein